MFKKEYPKTKFGSQNRGFTPSHFSEFNWLEYSIKKDSVFCFPFLEPLVKRKLHLL